MTTKQIGRDSFHALMRVAVTHRRFRPRTIDRALFLCLFLATVHACFGEWTRTIDCPPGRVYRDLRKDAGREEFCEHALPGSLVVKDGPYRFWFSEGHPGADGAYNDGREIGSWKECNRFDRCTQTTHEPVFPRETQRAAFKPEIPVSYAQGKYTIDFASCRSTWITQTGGPELIHLNIHGDSPYRCEVSYLPQSAIEHGGPGDYYCRIPFDVGLRKFTSLDLRRELPLAGLPQFCRPISRTGEPLLIQHEGFPLATTVDVQCAGIIHKPTGRDTLTLRLNQYAAHQVKQVAGQPGGLTTLLCQDEIDAPQISADSSGNQLLTYTFSANARRDEKQRKCAAEAFPLEPCR